MLNLQKGVGAALNLAKVTTELKVGLAWDAARGDGAAADLDVWAIPLKAGDKADEANILFYNQKSVYGGSVVHSGDNTTGDAAGDDETIQFKLAQLPTDVERVKIVINIFSPTTGKFGIVRNAKVTLYGASDTGDDLRYDLEEDYSNFKTLIVAELYRHNGSWKVKGLGEGYTDGIASLLASYGVQSQGG